MLEMADAHRSVRLWCRLLQCKSPHRRGTLHDKTVRACTVHHSASVMRSNINGRWDPKPQAGHCRSGYATCNDLTTYLKSPSFLCMQNCDKCPAGATCLGAMALP